MCCTAYATVDSHLLTEQASGMLSGASNGLNRLSQSEMNAVQQVPCQEVLRACLKELMERTPFNVHLHASKVTQLIVF